MHLGTCPRCGNGTLEHLSTHSYCWECGYSPEAERDPLPKNPFSFGRAPMTFFQPYLQNRAVFGIDLKV